MSNQTEQPSPPTDQALTLTRVFAAPRALVFKAWTEAERLAQWWGPKGFDLHVASFDLRPGGVFHYSIQPPNGQALWGKFVYREIVAPERLVFVSSFADSAGAIIGNPWAPIWPREVLNNLVLSEQDGKTTLKIWGGPLNATEAEIAAFAAARSSLEQGFSGTFAQLDAYLALA
jgi:uncharacterized protein YndB with AHSA1/START domain